VVDELTCVWGIGGMTLTQTPEEFGDKPVPVCSVHHQSCMTGLELNPGHPCYTGNAGKSLARPGRKQATATEDFEFHISYL